MDTNKILTEKELFSTYTASVLPFYASKLAGKLLKRFDLIQDREVLKSECKELIYEHFRDLKELIEAYSKGIEMSFFSFNKPQNKEN